MTLTRLESLLQRVFADERIGPPADVARLARDYAAILEEVAQWRRSAGDEPLVLGVCGSQGSGKSTFTRVLQEALPAEQGWKVATLSLDDLYLSRAERERLAEHVHPLLRTRGVPGTHDVALGVELIRRLSAAGSSDAIRLPRFDKATDDRSSQDSLFIGRADIVVLEGWCVGAVPQAADELAAPLNDLEREHDPHCVWRQYVNEQLAGPYQALFGLLDRLVMLQAPSFAVVFEWRREQERKLIARLTAGGGELPSSRAMNDGSLRRFVMHYERLTRHMLREMPARADLLVALDAQRSIVHITPRAVPSQPSPDGSP